MTNFWLENPNILLNKNYITEIWPDNDFNLARKLNAITRIIIIMAILGYFLTKSIYIPVSAVVSLIVLVIIYKSKSVTKSQTKEGFLSNPQQRNELKNVLDVCIGWGGRMLGSVCIDNVSYTGIEPYTKTFKALQNIKKDLKLTDKQVKLYNDVAENVLPGLKQEYDLALTSPPYYNLEIYTDEKTQSHHHDSYEKWVNNFLKPVVEGVLDKLVEGGKSCWSVKNIKTDGKYNLYDDVVKIHNDNGWILMKENGENVEFYVGNCLRPGLKDKDGKSKKSKEITYVFIKE